WGRPWGLAPVGTCTPPTGPCSVFGPGTLPQVGPLVLGANMKCSESMRGAVLNISTSCQAVAEHFQQCAEFPLLRNRHLGPLAVTVLAIPLARRAAARCFGVSCPSSRLADESNI